MYRILKPNGILINIDANYGSIFEKLESKGEVPSHPTQTLNQLLERNNITKLCSISKENRPNWDVDILIDLGIKEISLYLDIYRKLGIEEDINKFSARKEKEKIFAIVGKK